MWGPPVSQVKLIVKDAFVQSDGDGDNQISGPEFLDWAGKNPRVGQWVDNLSRLVLDSLAASVRVEDFAPEDFDDFK
eukprot:SAG22_NODE_388_length_11295_cov_14.512594_15_plen_77_part_00